MGREIDVGGMYLFAFMLVFVMHIFFTMKVNSYDVAYYYAFDGVGPGGPGQMSLSVKNGEANWDELREFIQDDLRNKKEFEHEVGPQVTIISVNKRPPKRYWHPFWAKV